MVVKKKVLRKRPAAKKKQANEEHFLRVKFGVLSDNRPEIYAFFYEYLPKILESLKEQKVGLKIERLEPLDQAHVNFNTKTRAQIITALVKFTISHGLHRDHNILVSVLPVKKLPQVLKDYNVLFDLFFTDTEVHCKKFKVEMMDGFYNTLLLIGEKKNLEKVRELLETHLQKKAEFKFIDHNSRG